MIPSPVANIQVANLNQYTRPRTITWDLSIDPSIVEYKVYRSEVSYGDFVQINIVQIPSNENSFLDNALPQTAVMPFTWWYKITALNSIGEESELSQTLPAHDIVITAFVDPPFIQNEPATLSEQNLTQPTDSPVFQVLSNTTVNPRWFLEIRKRHRWLLEMGGTRVTLLKRRYSGTVCPNFDFLRSQHKQIANADLSDPCYGTGWVGGYHIPLEISVSFVSPTAKRATLRDFGLWFDFEPKSWTLWEPELLDRDLIVRKDTGQRFEITDLSRTMWRGLVLRQNFDIRLLEPQSPQYKFPV